MNLSKLKAVFCITLLIVGSVSSFAQTNKQTSNDLKIRQRFTAGGQSFEQTRYIKGARERSETATEGMPTTIWQCDLKRYIRINDKTKTYAIENVQGANNASVDNNQKSGVRNGGVITYNYNRIDTGERKQMFGYTAHHIKTTIEMISSPGACSKQDMKMEQDGWYIDIDNGGADCNMGAYNQNYNGGAGGGCSDKVKMNFTGTQNYRFPLDETTTMTMPDSQNYTSRIEVLEISRAPLSASLFDIPAGYTQVKDMTELMSGASNENQGTQTQQVSTQQQTESSPLSQLPDLNANNNYPSSSKGNLPQGISNNKAQTATGPKKEGVIRIGVVTPKVQTSSGVEMAEPIRNSIVQYLSGTAVEVMIIDARVSPQIEAEAKQKECDFVLYTNVNHKKGGGGFGGMFGKVASQMPVGSVAGSTGSVVATQVATAAVITATTLSTEVKNKDEVTLDYQLVSPASSSQVAANKLKAKAKSDGEDIFSGLIEQMATNVLSVVVKR